MSACWRRGRARCGRCALGRSRRAAEHPEDDGTGATPGREVLRILSPPDLPALRKFLSPAYLVQRANGTYANKAETLENPSVLESYELSNLEATRTGPVIVARYDLVADVTIDGEKQSTEPAPRLAVFTKGEQGWQITAYANFNVPASEADATPPTT